MWPVWVMAFFLLNHSTDLSKKDLLKKEANILINWLNESDKKLNNLGTLVIFDNTTEPFNNNFLLIKLCLQSLQSMLKDCCLCCSAPYFAFLKSRQKGDSTQNVYIFADVSDQMNVNVHMQHYQLYCHTSLHRQYSELWALFWAMILAWQCHHSTVHHVTLSSINIYSGLWMFSDFPCMAVQ